MNPLTLIIIRHGEKPGGPWPGPGLTPEGEIDRKSLVIRGWQRAGAWAALFGAGLADEDYPPPARIYAADPAAPGTPERKSNKRLCETVAPLADRLGLTVDLTYGKGNEAALATALLHLDGVVLLCWDHEGIIDILSKIPVERGDPPRRWPDGRFDTVLRFDRAGGAEAFSYRQLLPRLLSGDSGTPF
jgi:broad specificity phosphatase PhoE